jgi:periplasmic protein TonB
VIRYNISKRDGSGSLPATGLTGPAGETRGRLSARSGGRIGFGLISVLFHAAALAALALVVTPPLLPAATDEAAVEMVFEEPAPSAEVQPEPPTPPEPAPPPQETSPPEIPPPPMPEAAQPPPPKPRLPPRPKPAPPRPVEAARPATQGTPVPAPPITPVVDPGWQASVSGLLATRKTYPEEARRRGEEGRVVVRFTVDRSGRVVDAAIVSASGSTLLDEAALGLLRQAALPAFPATMTQARITITTSMRYSLR